MDALPLDDLVGDCETLDRAQFQPPVDPPANPGPAGTTPTPAAKKKCKKGRKLKKGKCVKKKRKRR